MSDNRSGLDALTVATIRCSQCGRVSYPVDGTWITDRSALLSFAAPCRHMPDRTWLIDPDSLDDDEPVPWCSAIASTTAEPCRNRSRPDSGLCWVHDPQRAGRR